MYSLINDMATLPQQNNLAVSAASEVMRLKLIVEKIV